MTATTRALLGLAVAASCLSLMSQSNGRAQSDPAHSRERDRVLCAPGINQPVEAFVSQKYDSLLIDTTHDPWMIAYFSAGFDTLLTSGENRGDQVLSAATDSVSWLKIGDPGTTDEIMATKAIRFVTREWAEAHGLTTFVADSLARAEKARGAPVCVWIFVYGDNWSEVAALGVNVKGAAFGALETEVPDSLIVVVEELMTVRRVQRCKGEFKLN